MTSILADRRKTSGERLEEFRAALTNAPEICKEKACVYVTGSFGRGDAVHTLKRPTRLVTRFSGRLKASVVTPGFVVSSLSDMEFRIADTFADSLARLTADETKAAKTTAFDLQVNPAHLGLQFHKLDKPLNC